MLTRAQELGVSKKRLAKRSRSALANAELAVKDVASIWGEVDQGVVYEQERVLAALARYKEFVDEALALLDEPYEL